MGLSLPHLLAAFSKPFLGLGGVLPAVRGGKESLKKGAPRVPCPPVGEAKKEAPSHF